MNQFSLSSRLQRQPHSDSRGLTLLELLIVVAILAILTTVATRSLTGVGEQAQYDANENLCRDFKRALVGSPGALQSDGSPSITGFIPDHGRPPRSELETLAVGENDVFGGSATGKAYTLRELAVQQTSPTYRIYPIDPTTVTAVSVTLSGTNLINFTDSSSRIPAGWRGPYLQTGNDALIRDGWNKPVAAYETISERSLVDFWTTSYTSSSANNPQLSPFTNVPTGGYHALGSGVGLGPNDVVGMVIRPGPGSVGAEYNSLSLANYTNTFSAGIVFTNEYVAQLLCNISFNTSSSFGTNAAWAAPLDHRLAVGVIMYGPNPYCGNPAFSGNLNTRPVAVSWVASSPIQTFLNAANTNTLSNFPNIEQITYANNPVFNAATAQVVPVGSTYPLVIGPRVVKAVLVSINRTNGAPPQIYYGSARGIVLRPGYNTVQLSIP